MPAATPPLPPVVFAQPLSYDRGDTSVVPISDVQSERCDEAPDRDGWHTSETVSWLVLEAGRWQVAGGVPKVA